MARVARAAQAEAEATSKTLAAKVILRQALLAAAPVVEVEAVEADEVAAAAAGAMAVAATAAVPAVAVTVAAVAKKAWPGHPDQSAQIHLQRQAQAQPAARAQSSRQVDHEASPSFAGGRARC